MLVQVSIRRGVPICKTVSSYQEASEAVRKAIGHKPSSLVPRGTGLIADGGQIVAHVSYNGCVWAGREWQSGMVPLYDPR
jgi:hypothetical protein